MNEQISRLNIQLDYYIDLSQKLEKKNEELRALIGLQSISRMKMIEQISETLKAAHPNVNEN